MMQDFVSTKTFQRIICENDDTDTMALFVAASWFLRMVSLTSNKIFFKEKHFDCQASCQVVKYVTLPSQLDSSSVVLNLF
jgi:hypothetical protein